MISFISGRILDFLDDRIILVTENGQLGYEINFPHKLLPEGAEPGREFSCYIAASYQTTGAVRLYGLKDLWAKHIYEIASTVPRIGGKTACVIANSMSFETFRQMICEKNPLLPGKITGAGKTTLERVIKGLYGKKFTLYAPSSALPRVLKFEAGDDLPLGSADISASSPSSPGVSELASLVDGLFPLSDIEDVSAGLESLGFAQEETMAAIRIALKENLDDWRDEGFKSEYLLQSALRKLSRSK